MAKKDFDYILQDKYSLIFSMPEKSGAILIEDEPIFGNAMLFEKMK